MRSAASARGAALAKAALHPECGAAGEQGTGTGMPWSLGSFASENRADFLIATRVFDVVSCAWREKGYRCV